MTNERNIELEKAFEFVDTTDRHVFLTGKAGTGKTNFLRELLLCSHKKMMVLAPTGVAAINAGGTTIHSIFPIPREPLISSKNILLDNIRFTADNQDLFKSLDLLVFDEVSMIRADVFDAVDYLLRKIRKIDQPFGGIQLLFIGDLYQLSPIAKPAERTILETEYDTPFIIDSKVFRELDPIYIELCKVYRQADVNFLNLLECIRTATCTTEQLATINQLYKGDQSAPEGSITLTTLVRQADEINNESLLRLPDKEFCFAAIINGEFNEKSSPVLKDLKIKIGAQVMLVRNDSGTDKKYFNGKMGRVVNIVPDVISVQFSDSDRIDLKREIWVNSTYKVDRDSERIHTETLGTFQQFPIKLAWAITIHKSQGLTFESAVIDAGAAFAPGQVYVAFSRLRSLDNVWLRSKITESSITLHPVVKKFEALRAGQTDLDKLLHLSQQQYLRRIILAFFDWEPLHQTIGTNPPLKAAIFTLSGKSLTEDVQHSQNFKKQLLISASWNGEMDYAYLEDRFGKARAHFEPRLRGALNTFRNYIKDHKNDINHKRNIPLAQRTIKAINQALSSLELAERLLKLLVENVPLAEALRSLKKGKPVLIKSTMVEPNFLESTEKTSLLHFREGKSITEIAQLRQLSVQTIEYHLASWIKSDEVSIDELIAPALGAKIYSVARGLEDQSLLNLKKHFGEFLSLGQIAALQEYLAT